MFPTLQKHIHHNHGQFEGVFDYYHMNFHTSKNLSTYSLTAHDLLFMRTASADFFTTSAAADAALGDVRAGDGDEIKCKILQKKEICFCGCSCDICDRREPTNGSKSAD